MKFRATLRFTFHPEIHPDDAANAVIAWLRTTAKSRARPTPTAILDDAFLATLANMPADKWDADQKRMILDRLTDKNFCERLARVMAEGKMPMFDSIDLFLLRNWREIRWPEAANKGCPGLREWSPKGVCALMRYIGFAEHGEGWYSTRRKRIGLKGKRRYVVEDAITTAE